MNSTPRNKDGLQVLLETHLAELLDMTDKEVLNGEDPEKIRAQGLQLLQAAKNEAGRRRLAKARVSMEAAKTAPSVKIADVTPMEARRYIEQAANNPLFTMAARALSEMSDEDILRQYLQLRRLEQEVGSSKGHEE